MGCGILVANTITAYIHPMFFNGDMSSWCFCGAGNQKQVCRICWSPARGCGAKPGGMVLATVSRKAPAAVECAPHATAYPPPPSSFCSQAPALQAAAGLNSYVLPGVRLGESLHAGAGAPAPTLPSEGAKGSALQTGGTARSARKTVRPAPGGEIVSSTPCWSACTSSVKAKRRSPDAANLGERE